MLGLANLLIFLGGGKVAELDSVLLFFWFGVLLTFCKRTGETTFSLGRLVLLGLGRFTVVVVFTIGIIS